MNNLHQISKTFHGKLLLAGEYTVLEGGSTLAIPFHKVAAYLCYNPNSQLTDFWQNLMVFFKENHIELNYDQFIEDIEKGLGYESSIPVGYGVGSSGALVASLYDQYKIEEKAVDSLKSILSTMESFFHGKSSGIDPLVSFINRPILYHDGVATLLENDIDLSDWYLIDSKLSRSTAEYVSIYKTEVKDNHKNAIVELQSLNETFIHNLIANSDPSGILKQISEIQLKVFDKMITHEIKNFWVKGLTEGSYTMKLCGAGGGGYYLVFGKDLVSNDGLIPLFTTKSTKK